LVERAVHLAAIAFERDHIEERLHYLATHDPLTHLPNRYLIQENLSKSISRAQLAQSTCALLFIDLDRFKQVNDQMGHDYGDELLRQVAKRLTGSVRQYDTVGRLGGDEFVVILADIKVAEEAGEVATKLTHVLSSRFHVRDKEINISCSIGIALYPEHTLESQALLKKADVAMYFAKSMGRNNYKIDKPYMDGDATQSCDLEVALLAALELDQFVVYYQPQYNTASQTVTSVEALLRWNHPTMGLLLPSEFLPFAEESGLMVRIGKWVINHVCMQSRAWCDAGYVIRVAVNTSTNQLKDPEFSVFVRETLQRVKLDADLLELELSELVVTQFEKNIYENLVQLKKFGVHITVDDFGTGYSSLSYLKRLPIDGLKIDQSFTEDGPNDQATASIIDALLTLAKSLNLAVTAQGVEKADQWKFLSDHGCPRMQGIAISEPLEAGNLIKILKKTSEISLKYISAVEH
jgi:diguanylate cyclase (GGDEF)-like protein